MSDHRFLVRFRPRSFDLGTGGESQYDTSPGLERVSISGIDVRVSQGTPILLLEGGRGCVVGSLMQKGGKLPLSRALGATETDRIIEGQGKLLCCDYWGSYVAILLDQERRHVWAVRDPSGTFPCYRVEHSGEVLLASDMALFERPGGLALRVAWENLARFLYVPALRRIETCVEQVSEVRPGYATPLHDSAVVAQPLWNPWEHVQPRINSQAAGEELQTVIRSSVAALSYSYEHVVVAASGGLDSSIVAAALKREGRNFTCFTIATSEPSGDERPYARMVADHLGVRLIDRVYDPDRVNVLASSAPHLPRPLGKYFMQEMQRGLVEVSAEVGARAVFTGNGGDNVFCYLHSARPILDRLRIEGWTSEAWRTALDMCRITGADVFSMAAAVATDLLRPRRLYHWAGDGAFLAGDVGAALPSEPLEPHLDGNLRPFGKAQHIAMLMRIKNYIEGYDRVACQPTISPLVSQPVVEFCLSVPTWQWATGGINRALARSAFSEHLPPPIIARTSKSGPDSFTAHLFRRNRDLLRSALVDGLLASHGIIDCKNVEDAFAHGDIIQSQGHHRILMLAEAEAWARSFYQGIEAG